MTLPRPRTSVAFDRTASLEVNGQPVALTSRRNGSNKNKARPSTSRSRLQTGGTADTNRFSPTGSKERDPKAAELFRSNLEDGSEKATLFLGSPPKRSYEYGPGASATLFKEEYETKRPSTWEHNAPETVSYKGFTNRRQQNYVSRKGYTQGYHYGGAEKELLEGCSQRQTPERPAKGNRNQRSKTPHQAQTPRNKRMEEVSKSASASVSNIERRVKNLQNQLKQCGVDTEDQDDQGNVRANVNQTLEERVTCLLEEHKKNMELLKSLLDEKTQSELRSKDTEAVVQGEKMTKADTYVGKELQRLEQYKRHAAEDDYEPEEDETKGDTKRVTISDDGDVDRDVSNESERKLQGGTVYGTAEDDDTIVNYDTLIDADKEWARRIRRQYLGPVAETQDKKSQEEQEKTASKRKRRAATQPASHKFYKSLGSSKKNQSVARSFGQGKTTSSIPQKRDGEETIAARRAREDTERREKELEAKVNHKFKAKPVPSTTTQPLFTKVMKQKEMTAKYRVEARRRELEEMMKPFKGLMQHEEEMSAAVEAKRREETRKLEAELRESRRFRANPLPSSVQKDAQEQLKEEMAEKEKVRREKVAERAASTLASSAYPPRMEVHMKKEQQEEMENTRSSKAMEPQFPHQPQVNPHVPNFSKLHQKFSEQLVQTRRTLSRTTPQPFSFDSDEKKAVEKQKKDRKRQARLTSALDLMSSKGTSGESWLKEEQAQHRTQSTALKTGGSGQSQSRPRSARRASAKDVLRGGWMDPPSGPTPSLTKSVELQMRYRQAELRAKQIEEQSAAMEEELRRQKQLEASRRIKPIVQQVEKQRRPEPLAWQVDGSHPVAKERRRQADRELNERYRRNQQRIQEAQESRPPLFLRESIEHAKTVARQQALEEIAENASAAQENKRAWQELAAEYSTRSTSRDNDEYDSPTTNQVNQLRAYAMSHDLAPAEDEEGAVHVSNIRQHRKPSTVSDEEYH